MNQMAAAFKEVKVVAPKPNRHERRRQAAMERDGLKFIPPNQGNPGLINATVRKIKVIKKIDRPALLPSSFIHYSPLEAMTGPQKVMCRIKEDGLTLTDRSRFTTCPNCLKRLDQRKRK